MKTMVKCPACNGRGMIGYSTQTEDGVAFYDFECDYCKGRRWVSKKRAEKYEQEREECKGTTEEVETVFEGAGEWTKQKR